MDKEQLISNLLAAIESSDIVTGDQVWIPKSDAIRILQFLTGEQEIRSVVTDTDGKTLFFCSDCGKSFREFGREDKECFARWKYHTWYAECPWCKREVSRNDRYWR